MQHWLAQTPQSNDLYFTPNQFQCIEYLAPGVMVVQQSTGSFVPAGIQALYGELLAAMTSAAYMGSSDLPEAAPAMPLLVRRVRGRLRHRRVLAPLPTDIDND